MKNPEDSPCKRCSCVSCWPQTDSWSEGIGQGSCLDEEIKTTSVLPGYFHDSLKGRKNKNPTDEKKKADLLGQPPSESMADIFGTLSLKATGPSVNPSPERVVCVFQDGPLSNTTVFSPPYFLPLNF